VKSRTAEGKHTKRFIVEFSYNDGTWQRSGNTGISGFFPTREEAEEAIKPKHDNISHTFQYRVRQK
jgi:hypothetical protein